MRVNYPKSVREIAKREELGLFCVQLIDAQGNKITMYGPATEELRRDLQAFATKRIVREARK